jgi:hypothetical protein
MATRQTRLIIKNSNVANRPLPISLLQGEAIVNTTDGVMFFSGVTTGSTNWTPAGTGATEQTFFEVGSNLYDLQLRNRITKYEGQTGSTLNGKFLSGTTDGFVLADITSIAGIDTYVTGSTFTGATNDTNVQYSELQYNIPVVGGPYFINTEDTFTTGGTYDNNTKLITFDKNNGSGYTVDLSTIDTNDTYVTGGTNTAATTDSPNGTIGLEYNQDIAPGTYSLPYSDVFTTGFTYDSANNTFSIKDNSGNTYSDSITTVSGLTFSNLTQGRVVYVGSGGLLTDQSGFTYNDGTNTLGVDNIQATGDVVVQGSLTVFGPSVSAFTTNLYVEDPNITLNYNPTGSTDLTSVGAGWTIQDGSGIANTATTFNIGVSYLNGNLSPNTEYTSLTGNENRNLFTQVGDIIIRNTNYDANSPDGVRVLTENDQLDGGTY